MVSSECLRAAVAAADADQEAGIVGIATARLAPAARSTRAGGTTDRRIEVLAVALDANLVVVAALVAVTAVKRVVVRIHAGISTLLEPSSTTTRRDAGAARAQRCVATARLWRVAACGWIAVRVDTVGAVRHETRPAATRGARAVLAAVARAVASTALIDVARDVLTAVAAVELPTSANARAIRARAAGWACRAVAHAHVVPLIAASARTRIPRAARLAGPAAGAARIVIADEVRPAVSLLAAWLSWTTARTTRSTDTDHGTGRTHVGTARLTTRLARSAARAIATAPADTGTADDGTRRAIPGADVVDTAAAATTRSEIATRLSRIAAVRADPVATSVTRPLVARSTCAASLAQRSTRCAAVFSTATADRQ